MLERLVLYSIQKDILIKFQEFLVLKVQVFHNRQRLKVIYITNKSTWQTIRDLLDRARETNIEGPVAQYLSVAKLQFRFPEPPIENFSYSTADQQLNRPGDFLVKDTAFHITVAPMPAVYEKCRHNLDAGYRVCLLGPDRLLAGARQNAELVVSGQIMVESIESFVSQNIDELSMFSKDRLSDGFRQLFEMYNDRVDEVEVDKSMLLEIPPNLL